jgi:hypothetical protein
MANDRFKRGSGVFQCRHCTRQTRDTNGDNGRAELCEDCYDGCAQDNGYCDTSDPIEKAQFKRDADACFQRAVNKGGVLPGYTQQA